MRVAPSHCCLSDIRDFFRPLPLDRDAVEMGRDHAGRFSGMVYVRLRSTTDLNLGLRKQSEFLCGRQVILQRLDPGTPNIFRPGSDGRGGTIPGHPAAFDGQRQSSLDPRGGAPPPPLYPSPSCSGGGGSGGTAAPAAPTYTAEPRPWPSASARPTRPAAKDAAATTPAGHVCVSLRVAGGEGARERVLSDALAAAPAAESLAAVRHFLMHDPRLPHTTRRAMTFMSELRAKLLEDPHCTESTLTRHAFRSPFESAGVLGYTLPEVEACFGTRSADSVFWPIFQTFHTIVPHDAAEAAADDVSLGEFLAA